MCVVLGFIVLVFSLRSSCTSLGEVLEVGGMRNPGVTPSLIKIV